jgi:hypothetical protein
MYAEAKIENSWQMKILFEEKAHNPAGIHIGSTLELIRRTLQVLNKFVYICV